MSNAIVRTTCMTAMMVLLGTGCLGVGRKGLSVRYPIPVSAFAESSEIDHRPPYREGQLTAAQLAGMASSIKSLRADPTELFMMVGDTIRVADLVRVFAFDSAGTLLGELPYYSYSYSGSPRSLWLLQDGRIQIRRKGTVVFTALLGGQRARGRKAESPSASVAIKVTYDGDH